jgi:hypothetical protein
MKEPKWWELLNPPKEYNYSQGEDIADSVALIVICAMLLGVVLFL